MERKITGTKFRVIFAKTPKIKFYQIWKMR